MDFKIKINNIGKLRDVDISLKPFTVLAGPNNTGKSFISKTLYSVLSLTHNPLPNYMQLQRLEKIFDIQKAHLNEYDHYYDYKLQQNESVKKILNSKLKEAISNIKNLKITSTTFNLSKNTSDFDKKINEHLNVIEMLSSNIFSIFSSQHKKVKSSKKLNEEESEIVMELDFFQKELKEEIIRLKKIKQESLEQKITKGIIQIMENNLKGNFQIPVLSELLGNPIESADITIQNGRKNKENEINISLFKKNIQYNSSIQGLIKTSFRTIYLESPFHWKLRKALKRANRPFFPTARRSLLIPKYFRDLNIMLGEELTGEPAFPEILKKLNQDIIKGKIVEDESGTLKFKENKGGSYSLPSTATGVVQLGILALLIEKKALDKGTILFIDEPEVNLHPAWQIKMMEILFNLVTKGAFVVMATHSVDMLKWLEEYLKENPQKENLVALNQMILKEDGSATNVKQNKDIQTQIRAIKENLTKPYLKMYLEGVE